MGNKTLYVTAASVGERKTWVSALAAAIAGCVAQEVSAQGDHTKRAAFEPTRRKRTLPLKPVQYFLQSTAQYGSQQVQVATP